MADISIDDANAVVQDQIKQAAIKLAQTLSNLQNDLTDIVNSLGANPPSNGVIGVVTQIRSSTSGLAMGQLQGLLAPYGLGIDGNPLPTIPAPQGVMQANMIQPMPMPAVPLPPQS